MWELVGVVMTELRGKNSFGILLLVSNNVRKTLPLRISEITDFGFRIGGAKSNGRASRDFRGITRKGRCPKYLAPDANTYYRILAPRYSALAVQHGIEPSRLVQ